MKSNLLPKRIKICGITNLADAEAAIDCGAATLGFVFHPSSPRAVAPATVRAIVRQVSGLAICIGVFVDEPPSRVRQIVETCGLNAVQCHGHEPDACLAHMGAPAIKALRVRTAADLDGLRGYPTAWGMLCDAWSPQGAGGNGLAWDWSLAAARPRLDKPFILAGGLTPENVSAAIRQVWPDAVDVSSGVEVAPGRKDYDKLRRFVALAQEAFDAEHIA